MHSDVAAGLIDTTKLVCLVIDEAHRATGNYAYCTVIKQLEELDLGFRILSLSATPVSKIENLQTVVTSLRCSMFEVRDEEDAEIKQYTHDKNIVEILIDRENHITELEQKLYQLMLLPMAFLKQMGILPQTMQPRYMNVMAVRKLCDGFQANAENYAPAMMGSFFQRAVLLQNLCHAKQLLMT
jgi:ERCC4-related helicase